MECSDIRKKLSAYQDGEVTDEEKERISEHLESCDLCREELQGLSLVSDSLELMSDVDAPPFFTAKVKRRIAERESRGVIRSLFPERVRRVLSPVAATVLVVLALFVGGSMGRELYDLRTEVNSSLDTEVASYLGVGLLDDYPEGSVGSAYGDLLFGEGK